MKERIEPTYVSYVIRFPQEQDDLEFKDHLLNDSYDHFYNEGALVSPWIYRATFFLTERITEDALKLFRKRYPSVNGEVVEVRTQVFR
jgi:hypothetical protein